MTTFDIVIITIINIASIIVAKYLYLMQLIANLLLGVLKTIENWLSLSASAVY